MVQRMWHLVSGSLSDLPSVFDHGWLNQSPNGNRRSFLCTWSFTLSFNLCSEVLSSVLQLARQLVDSDALCKEDALLQQNKQIVAKHILQFNNGISTEKQIKKRTHISVSENKREQIKKVIVNCQILYHINLQPVWSPYNFLWNSQKTETSLSHFIKAA